MQTFRNLVSDREELHRTVQLLRRCGGRAPVAQIADEVLQAPDLDIETAELLLAELIKDDWRLRLADRSHEVELVCEDDECRALGQTDYVVFDVETTGPKTPPCRIIELGAYRVSQGRIVAEFKTLVNPETTIPPFISQLTGITDRMVARAPLFREVADDWLRFAGAAVLVAHNAIFDVRFINHELSLVYPGRRMVNTHLCTVALARRVVPEATNHRLHTLAEHFAVPTGNRHRAPDDARATAEVFLLLLELLRRNGVKSLAEARRFNMPPPAEATRPTGDRLPKTAATHDGMPKTAKQTPSVAD